MVSKTVHSSRGKKGCSVWSSLEHGSYWTRDGAVVYWAQDSRRSLMALRVNG